MTPARRRVIIGAVFATPAALTALTWAAIAHAQARAERHLDTTRNDV